MVEKEIKSGQVNLDGLNWTPIIFNSSDGLLQLKGVYFDVSSWSAAHPTKKLKLRKRYEVKDGLVVYSNPVIIEASGGKLITLTDHTGDKLFTYDAQSNVASTQPIKYRYVEYTDLDGVPIDGFIILNVLDPVYLEFTPDIWEKIDGIYFDLSEWFVANPDEILNVWKEVKVDKLNYSKSQPTQVLSNAYGQLVQFQKHEGDKLIRFGFQAGGTQEKLTTKIISPIYTIRTSDNPLIKDIQETNRGAVIYIEADQANDTVSFFVNCPVPQDFVNWGEDPITIQAKRGGAGSATIDIEMLCTSQANEIDRGDFGAPQTIGTSWNDYTVNNISGGNWIKGYPFKIKITIVMTDSDTNVSIGLGKIQYLIPATTLGTEKIYYRYVRFQN